MLLKINERKRWVDPSILKSNPAQLSLQDEEIFQTARLVKYVLRVILMHMMIPSILSFVAAATLCQWFSVIMLQASSVWVEMEALGAWDPLT